MLNKSFKQSVCVVSTKKDAYSETFIRAHIERLPAKVLAIYDAWPFPQRWGNNRFILPLPVLISSNLISALPKAFNFISPECADRVSMRLKTLGLANLFRKNRVNAVLAEYGPTGVAVMEACRLAAIPLIVHFHGCDASAHRTLSNYGEGYRRMFCKAAAIIAVSRDMEAALLALGAPREKLHYSPYGIDCFFFKQTQPAQQPPHFLAVGRFVDKKAPHLTLLAFNQVVRVVPEARLTMYGDGALWEACKQLTRALKIADKVNFPGPCPHIELAAVMQNTRAFVQHSLKATYGDSEGTPVAVLEAGASGLPVVATRHGGIKDTVIHGETGFLVDEGDLDGMAAYMLKLAQEPELAGAMGRRARKHISANFSMEQSITKLYGIIEQAILRPF
jgi:colanic acid/amylovoran biosynthesis glycosyltransferase